MQEGHKLITAATEWSVLTPVISPTGRCLGSFPRPVIAFELDGENQVVAYVTASHTFEAGDTAVWTPEGTVELGEQDEWESKSLYDQHLRVTVFHH